jgi:hypothetical protein
MPRINDCSDAEVNRYFIAYFATWIRSRTEHLSGESSPRTRP